MDPKELRAQFLVCLNDICIRNSAGKKSLQLDPETERAIELTCQYINLEPVFEAENECFSFSKGLLYRGNPGAGKTNLIEAYRDVKKKLFQENVGFRTCQDINLKFMKVDTWTDKIRGYAEIQPYLNPADKTERVFDDFGAEELTVFNYGNKICIMAEILSERYKNRIHGAKTHMTTNDSPQQTEDKYGSRIVSRTFEMFNTIWLGKSLNSKDYRR